VFYVQKCAETVHILIKIFISNHSSNVCEKLHIIVYFSHQLPLITTIYWYAKSEVFTAVKVHVLVSWYVSTYQVRTQQQCQHLRLCEIEDSSLLGYDTVSLGSYPFKCQETLCQQPSTTSQKTSNLSEVTSANTNGTYNL
jgi:hypothetical protein